MFKLIGPLSELLWSFGLVWIFCNLCEKLSTAFDEEIYDVIDQLDWYLYPPEMAKILPIIIVNAQRRIVVECFGKIYCNLETFKKVCFWLLKKKIKILPNSKSSFFLNFLKLIRL